MNEEIGVSSEAVQISIDWLVVKLSQALVCHVCLSV